MAQLQFLSGSRSVTTYRLNRERTIFGRMHDCDIVLTGDMVSRHHAEIRRVGDGYVVEDLGSRNGTFLNQIALTAPQRLKDHDWIGIDNTLFEFVESENTFDDNLDEKAAQLQCQTTAQAEWLRGSDAAIELDDRVTRIDLSDFGEGMSTSPNAKLQAILGITRELGSCLNVSQIMQRVLSSVCQAFPHAGEVCVLEVDAATDVIRPICHRHAHSDDSGESTLGPISLTTVRYVVDHCEALIHNEPPSDSGIHRSALDVAPTSYMCAPLVGASRRAVGAVWVETEQTRYSFTEEDLDLLVCFAALAASSLDQARNHDARYRAVVDTAADAILTLDSLGRIESANPAVSRLFGYRLDELEGRPVNELLVDNQPHRKGLQWMESRLQQTQSHKAQRGEIAGRCRDGTRRALDVSVAEFMYEDKRHFTLICQDITDRKQAEQALRESQQRLSRMVETGVVGIAFGNCTGEILEGNDAFYDLIGRRADEIRSRKLSWRDITAPEYVQVEKQAALQLRCEGRTGPYEKEFIRGDDRRVPVSLSLATLPGTGGQHVALIVDNTHRKRAEAELRSLNSSLEQRIRERTAHIQLLQEVAVIGNEASSVEEACESSLEMLCARMSWSSGRVFLRAQQHSTELVLAAAYPDHADSRWPIDGERLRRKVLKSGHARCNSRPKHSSRSSSRREASGDSPILVVFPIPLGAGVCGTLEFIHNASDPPSEEVLQVMTNVGAQLGRVVERRRLQRELVDAVWQQQRMIGQEIHDTFGQELTGIRMLADSLRFKLSSAGAPEADKAAELTKLIEHAQQETRRIARGLFPVEIFEQGLMAALDELAHTVSRSCGIDCRFECPQPVEVNGNDVATHLFRIAQEAVNNSVRHGKAKSVCISLTHSGKSVMLEISDDGCGLSEETTARTDGMGMRVMEYRTRLLGGRLSIKPGLPSGLVVRCEIEQRTTHENEDWSREYAHLDC